MKIIAIIIILKCALSVNSQNTQMNKINRNIFYCTDWIFRFPDTIYVFNKLDSIPELTEYSVIRKNDQGYYDLFCWTGKICLENPTQVKGKLKVKFKEDAVVFKLGNKKERYLYLHNNEQIGLIKIKN